MKKRSVVTKLSFVTIVAFLVLFIIFNVVTNRITYMQNKETGEELIALATEQTTSEIGAYINEMITTMQADGEVLLGQLAKGNATPVEMLDYKQRTLPYYEETIAYSLVMDSVNFSQLPSSYAPFVRDDGYFSAQLLNKERIEIVQPADEAVQLTYEQAVQAKKVIIRDPHIMTIDGQTQLMITIAYPIMYNDNVVAVAMTHFSTHFLQPIIERNIPEGAIQRVAMPTGAIIADTNSDEIVEGANLRDYVANYEEVMAAVSNHESIDMHVYAPTLAEDVYGLFLPIDIASYDEYFAVQTFIPLSIMMSGLNASLKISIVAAIIMAFLLMTVLLYAIRKLLKPLQMLEHALKEAAQGNLTTAIDTHILKRDEIGGVGEAFNMMRTQIAETVQHVNEQAHIVEQQSSSASRSMEAMSASSEQTTKAIEEIATGAQLQATHLETANREMGAFSEKMDTLYGVAAQMLESVAQSTGQAAIGRKELEKLHYHNRQTNSGNEALEEQMDALATHIMQIDAVMLSIQRVTEQTNLLALNASIEAARAGEHGKGFAVVAEEVRKLAEQSREETERVQQIVSDILHETGQTKELTARNSAILQEQTEAVISTDAAFTAQLLHTSAIEDNITRLMQELTTMLQEKEQIVYSMQHVAAISEQSAASAEEIAAGAEEQQNELEKIVTLVQQLHHISQQLKQHVAYFETA